MKVFSRKIIDNCGIFRAHHFWLPEGVSMMIWLSYEYPNMIPIQPSKPIFNPPFHHAILHFRSPHFPKNPSFQGRPANDPAPRQAALQGAKAAETRIAEVSGIETWERSERQMWICPAKTRALMKQPVNIAEFDKNQWVWPGLTWFHLKKHKGFDQQHVDVGYLGDFGLQHMWIRAFLLTCLGELCGFDPQKSMRVIYLSGSMGKTNAIDWKNLLLSHRGTPKIHLWIFNYESSILGYPSWWTPHPHVGPVGPQFPNATPLDLWGPHFRIPLFASQLTSRNWFMGFIPKYSHFLQPWYSHDVAISHDITMI